MQYLNDSRVLVAVIIILAIVVIALLTVILRNTFKKRRLSKISANLQEVTAPTDQKICFIVNPVKPGSEDVCNAIRRRMNAEGITNYTFVQTTVEQSGGAQASDAIDDGADLIVAVGGDGTVRAVSCGIAKSSNPRAEEVQMAIIPNGTGNVLAYNLGIPSDNVEVALDIAFRSQVGKLDVGFCRNQRDSNFDHAFVTIAGVGYDANMVKNTRDGAKEKLGAAAYYLAGIRETFRPKMSADITITLTSDEVIRTSTKLRSLMVGNSGKIPGFTLIPDAKVDDGVLDVVAINTGGGLLGWMQLGTGIVMQKFGLKNNAKYKLGRIDHIQAKEVMIELSKPQYAQLDGDLLEKTDFLYFYLAPRHINLRYPKSLA